MTPVVAPSRRLGLGFWSFVLLMLGLTVLFAVLGVWQVERLAWKEKLIADVTARQNQPPVALPADWTAAALEPLAFHPVTVTGQWLPQGTVRVFTNLSTAKGQASGPGYWIATPFVVSGGTVFINRGFVPDANSGKFTKGEGLPQGEQTLTGLLTLPEATGVFTPAPDTSGRIDWVRDPARLAKLAGVDGPVLPAMIDLPAGRPGDLPRGGETVVDFPNNHLGYAMTWFGFALLTPALLAAWIWQRLRRVRPTGDA